MNRYRRLEERVADIDARGLRRRLRSVVPVGGGEVLVDGRRATLWCSNDYLGIADHPELVASWRGGGAGAARLISGNRPAHDALEEALSALHGRPATLFPSGYHANAALYATVPEAGDVVASDALNHASIIDGLRLSRARRVILPHLDPSVPADTTMVAVEGLYSMDGDSPELTRYRGAWWLAVDDAHAVGAVGPGGRGIAAAQGIEPDFLVGTLGKAYGVAGAFVVGPPALRELLVSAGRAFVYTTGMPEALATAALTALRLADDARRERLAANVTRLRDALRQLGIPALGSAHIVPVVTGPRTMEVAAALLERGIFAAGIRFPTVPLGTERVRLAVSAAHTDEQIDRCAEALATVLRG